MARVSKSDTQLPPETYFYQYAGYSWDSNVETAEQGRKRCAESLAAAEKAASEAGCSFRWMVDDDSNSRDFNTEVDRYELWGCIMLDGQGIDVASLWAIDFGPDGEPWDDTYKRVVQAELAAEWLAALPKE